MSKYKFLQDFIESLPKTERLHYSHGVLDYGYILQKGISQFDLTAIQSQYKLALPKELVEFYTFSYGALLNEIEILTVPQIIHLKEEWQQMRYDEDEDDVERLIHLIPFARLRGVGDVFVFDMAQQKDSYFSILDGFHEYPPSQWESICFGLENWLTQLVKNDFQQYWLKTD
ncbi:MAG: SMI1/KNR4 family protein [Anaerolineales bacterium]|nr:SMI1/KNR4 family protein [Anaerolineales bacterium]